MTTKFSAVFRFALRRFLMGVLGVWCVLGPMLLFNASASTGWGLTAALLVLLFLCYFTILVICLRAKWSILKELFSATGVAMCFMIVGLLMNEMTGIFIAVKHKLVIVYAFVGFLIAELIKPWGLSKAFAELGGGERCTATARPKDDSSTESVAQEGGLAAEMAELSSRSTEYQRTLREHEKQQSCLLKVEAHNQYLEDMLNGLRDQLKESTAEIREAVDVSVGLQGEIAGLKQQIVEREAMTTSLQLAQSVAKIQYEFQEIRFEDQRLREELDEQRSQQSATDHRLQELVRRNQTLADGYERLDAEVADLKRLQRDSQSRDREMGAVGQQLANVEARATFYREQQERLEAGIVAIEHELSEQKTRTKLLDDALERLRQTERVCRNLAENDRRLWVALAVWQQGLAAGDQNRRQEPQIRQLQADQAGLITEKRAALKKVAAAEDLIAGTYREKPEEAAWVPWASLQRQSRFGAAAASIVVLAGAVAVGVLHGKFSASRAVAVRAAAVVPETNSQEPIVEAVSSRPTKPAPRQRGTFLTIRPTQVYSGPSENAAFVADIGAGMKLNVVDSGYGWLEIRSKHGRPPGFVRQDAAVRIVRN